LAPQARVPELPGRARSEPPRGAVAEHNPPRRVRARALRGRPRP
jgi:hypothetical protein